jgi:hypothetical protein
MAINPNTDFTAGAILTAAQQNRFPRGVMQRVTSVATTTGGAEVVTLTLPSFTAVANRFYRITYFEPYYETVAGSIEINARIRLTNISGTVLARGTTFESSAGEGQVQAVFVGTLTAGATVIVATIQSSGTTFFYGDATYNRLLWVEDIGPA